MSHKSCILVGAPVQSGASQPGCLMGPDAFRTAGLAETLEELKQKQNLILCLTQQEVQSLL